MQKFTDIATNTNYEKPLNIGQEITLSKKEKPKKIHELGSGPFTVLKKITHVIYEIRLDSDNNLKKVSHRNHLKKYFPVEENATKYVNDFSLKQESYPYQPFYENVMQTGTKKLNSPLNKKLFQSPTGISENLPRKINHRRENNIQNQKLTEKRS